MRTLIKKSLVALSAIACIGGAQATLIDFESVVNDPVFSPFAPLYGDGDEFYQGEFWFDPFSNSATSMPGDLVGAMIDGGDLVSSCFGITCPVNNPSQFYATLNDGVLAMGSTLGNKFKVNGFDASFIGAAGAVLPGVSGLLRIQGVVNGVGSLTQTYQLPGPDALGNLNFFQYNTQGAFATTEFDFLYIFGFTCNTSGSCSAFGTNAGQFAIDNINVTVAGVPEPASLALAALGLLAAGAARRKRAA